jgi:polyphosphate glucokinase
MKHFEPTSLIADTPARVWTRKVLVVDVGGSSVKILATGQTERRSFRSGSTLTPSEMVSGVKKLAADWTYDAVSIGYPGPVLGSRPICEAVNLGRGWVGFDFARAFGRPVKVVNDAAMQALGSYHGGKMLFLGLGTGLGTTMIVDGIMAPMEIGHLPYRKATYEHYVGGAGLERSGKKKWRQHVADVVKCLIDALQPDYTVIGGGNVAKLKTLPPKCRTGDNAHAFRGGFLLWAEDSLVPADLPRGRAHQARERTPRTATHSEILPMQPTDELTSSGPPGSHRDDAKPPRTPFGEATTRGAVRIKRKHTSPGLWRAS